MKKKNLLILCTAFFSLSLHGIRPEYLKNTYRPLKQMYKHCSPLQGALWKESDLVQNYYNYGNPRDATIQLIHILFTRDGGFSISTNPSYIAFHLSAKIIGIIISQLEMNPALSKEQLETIISNDTDWQESIVRTKSEHNTIRDRIRAFNKQIQSMEKATTRGVEIEKQIKQLASQASSEELTRRRYDTSFIPQRLDKFCETIISSMNEIKYYPPFAPYSVLLSFLYSKAQSKDEFWSYFEQLSPLQIWGTSEPVKEQWISNNFSPSDVNEIQEELRSLFSDLSAKQKPISDELYEKTVYGQILMRYYWGGLPAKSTRMNLSFENNKFLQYGDCCETTIRDLCNILLYDKDKGIFDLNKAPNIATLDPQFRGFYSDNKFKQASNINDLEIHKAWSEILENKPWLVYSRMAYTDENQRVVYKVAPLNPTATNYHDGFIIISPEFESTLEHQKGKAKISRRWYVPIDGVTERGYELQPSVRNLIVTIDRLFGLNLFEGNISQELIRPDFNRHYWPLVMSKFNRFRHLSWPDDLLSRIDDDDYSRQLHLSFDTFYIELSVGHAELYPFPNTKENKTAIIDLGFFIINKCHLLPSDDVRYPYLQLLTIFPFTLSQLRELLLKDPDAWKYLYFLLGQNDELTYLLVELCAEQEPFKSIFQQNERLAALIFQLISSLKEHSQNFSGLVTFYQRLYTLFGHQLLNNEIIHSLHALIEKIGQNPLSYVNNKLFPQFLELLAHLRIDYLKEFIPIAKQLFNKGDYRESFELWKELFKNNIELAFIEAQDLAKQAVQNSDTKIREQALRLFIGLIVNQYKPAYADALSAAKKTSQSNEPAIKEKGTQLLQLLSQEK